MKTKLLRKIHKNWEIKKYNDPEHGVIHRAFHKGQWIRDAWRFGTPDGLQDLVHRIAVYEFDFAGDENYWSYPATYESFVWRRKEKKMLAKKKMVAEREGKKVWYLQNK